MFGMILVDFTDDVFALDKALKVALDKTTSYFDFEKMKGRDDFIFISSMPWISFTGIDHTMSLNKNDAIPQVT